MTERTEEDRREHAAIYKKIGDVEKKHDALAIAFAGAEGKALFYKLALCGLQCILTGVGIAVLLCVMQLKIDVALIQKDQVYIKKAISSTKKVSMYNQDILKGTANAK